MVFAMNFVWQQYPQHLASFEVHQRCVLKTFACLALSYQKGEFENFVLYSHLVLMGMQVVEMVGHYRFAGSDVWYYLGKKQVVGEVKQYYF